MAKPKLSEGFKSDAVSIRFPPWIMGGSPKDLEEFCGWKMTPIDVSKHVWGVQLREMVHGDRPKNLAVHLLANPKNADLTDSYSRVRRLKQADEFMTVNAWESALKQDALVAANLPSNLPTILKGAANLTVAAPSASTLAGCLQQIMVVRILPALPKASLYFLEHTWQLSQRYGAARALLRSGDSVGQIEAGGLAFRSGNALFNDTSLGFSAYLDPLLTSLSPWVWGYAVGRAGGVIIYLFGETHMGRGTIPGDLLLLSVPKGPSRDPRTLKRPNLHETAFGAALKWWVSRLDVLLSTATDPSISSVSGIFDAAKAVEKLLSLEQIFRHCQSIAANADDDHARRILLFAVLDTLPGLNKGLQWNVVTSASKVRAFLDELEEALPDAIKEILLPRARRAAEALEALPDGFFVKYRQVDGRVLVPNKQGKDVPILRETAASQWLRVIRNSVHGFEGPQSVRDRQLFVMHNGEMSPAIADLAWLHLLRLLTFPELLRPNNYANGGPDLIAVRDRS